MPSSRAQSIRNVIAVICLAFITFLSMFPLYWLLRSSLMTQIEIFEFPPKMFPSEIQWNNYTEIFSVIPFGLYFRNTMTILIPVVLGIIVTSSLSGYGFARLNFPLKNMWFALLISTMMLPQAVTLIPTFILWTKLGLVNTFWPLILPAWLGGGVGGAFSIFLMRQFFLNISRELDESALIDGASYFQIYSRILLPLITPVLVVVGFFSFMQSWNEFLEPLIYLHDQEKFTLALGLLNLRGEYVSDWNLIMAAASVMTIPAIIVFFIGQKYFVEGVGFTGIKG